MISDFRDTEAETENVVWLCRGEVEMCEIVEIVKK